MVFFIEFYQIFYYNLCSLRIGESQAHISWFYNKKSWEMGRSEAYVFAEIIKNLVRLFVPSVYANSFLCSLRFSVFR